MSPSNEIVCWFHITFILDFASELVNQTPNALHHPPASPIAVFEISRVAGRVHAVVRLRLGGSVYFPARAGITNPLLTSPAHVRALLRPCLAHGLCPRRLFGLSFCSIGSPFGRLLNGLLALL